MTDNDILLLQMYKKARKKKILIVVFVVFFVAIIIASFLVISPFYFAIITDTISIEYGEEYIPSVEDFVELTDTITLENTSLKYELQYKEILDEETGETIEIVNYPEVGEYSISINHIKTLTIANRTITVPLKKSATVVVSDTTPPQITSSILEVVVNVNEEFEPSELESCFAVEDLSELNDIEYDCSGVDLDLAGEYIMVVSVSDIYDNTSSLEIKIIVEGEEETTTEEQTTETATEEQTTETTTEEQTTETTTKETTTTTTTTKKSTTTTTKKSSSSSSSSSSKTLSYTKDFLFTDGYTMDTVTDAVLAYVEKKGITSYKYEPLKDSSGVYIGMRLYVYS